MSSTDDLPRAFPAMWRALRRGYEAEPALLSVSFGLTLLAAIPDPLIAWLLKVLADGLLAADRTRVLGSMLALAACAVATWVLTLLSTRTQRRFRDRVTIVLESHVARLQASVATLEHHERPEYLDRLAILRNQVFMLDHMYMSVFATCAWILRLGVTLALIVSVHPALALLAVFALPTVLTSSWRPAVERAAEERAASPNRLARQLFELATTASPAKEVRVARVREMLAARRREAWARGYRPVASARLASAGWHAAGWSVFGAAYVGAIAFVTTGVGATPGEVLLLLAAGARLSAYLGAAVGEIGFLRGVWLDGAKRLAWLEDYAAAQARDADADVPARIEQGIRFEHVWFAYPGTDRFVLEDVDLLLERGSVVAIVGENGAGKTTLVKLLSGMYRPTRGRILVDGVDLARMAPEAWRSRLSGAFQDFFRFELTAGHSIGLGDLPRLEDARAVTAAVDRAGAEDVVARLPAGLDTQLGRSWPGGVDLSFGQWQKLALARGFMRNNLHVLVLDEPTAALDAETEHALFERYAAAARRDRITVLVSHRFSTVRMADFIVVLDGARVVESGTHNELVGARGQYAQLYAIQARAYR